MSWYGQHAVYFDREKNHRPFRHRVRSGGAHEFSGCVNRQPVKPLHPKTPPESFKDGSQLVEIVMGEAEGPLCPIAALLSYLYAIRGQDPEFFSGLRMIACCRRRGSWQQFGRP